MPRGFANVGGSCHFNSLLQAFLCDPKVVERIMVRNYYSGTFGKTLQDEIENTLNASLTMDTGELFIKFAQEKKAAAGPECVLVTYEALVEILDIEDLTRIQINQRTSCCNCLKSNTVRSEQFYILLCEDLSAKPFADRLTIEEDNITDYDCLHCKKKTDAIMRTTRTLPEILAVGFAIYNDQGTGYEFPSKIYHHRQGYKIQARVDFIGFPGALGGHYTCVGLRGDQWYNFNDKQVIPANAPLPKHGVFMVFYQKM